MPGFLPPRHGGDAQLGDHGHPSRVGGPIRTHEPTEALARTLAEERAKILSATVSRTAQSGFWSFAVEVEGEGSERHRRPKRRVASRWGSRTCGAPHEASFVGTPSRRWITVGR
jgi:hypothetical protein